MSALDRPLGPDRRPVPVNPLVADVLRTLDDEDADADEAEVLEQDPALAELLADLHVDEAKEQYDAGELELDRYLERLVEARRAPLASLAVPPPARRSPMTRADAVTPPPADPPPAPAVVSTAKPSPIPVATLAATSAPPPTQAAVPAAPEAQLAAAPPARPPLVRARPPVTPVGRTGEAAVHARRHVAPSYRGAAAVTRPGRPALAHSDLEQRAWLPIGAGLAALAVASTGWLAWESEPPPAESAAPRPMPAPERAPIVLEPAPAAPRAGETAAAVPPPAAPTRRPAQPSAPAVGFVSAARIVVPEGTRFIQIPVRATGPLREPVRLSVTAVSGAAQVNQDFVPPVPTLTLTRAQPQASVLVSLLTDDQREHVEDFNVVLRHESGGARLATRDISVVITDDD
jgi:hypothetical protein